MAKLAAGGSGQAGWGTPQAAVQTLALYKQSQLPQGWPTPPPPPPPDPLSGDEMDWTPSTPPEQPEPRFPVGFPPPGQSTPEADCAPESCRACVVWTHFVLDLYRSFTALQRTAASAERRMHARKRDHREMALVVEAMQRSGLLGGGPVGAHSFGRRSRTARHWDGWYP